MYQIELFQYTKKLETNMGYCTIDISTHSKETTTIVAKNFKFGCNRLLVGMCTPGDII